MFDCKSTFEGRRAPTKGVRLASKLETKTDAPGRNTGVSGGGGGGGSATAGAIDFLF